MRKLLTITLFAIAAMAAMTALAVQPLSDVQAPRPSGSSEVRAACGCPKTAPVCCHNCNGSFAYCARSFAFCPECPAP